MSRSRGQGCLRGEGKGWKKEKKKGLVKQNLYRGRSHSKSHSAPRGWWCCSSPSAPLGADGSAGTPSVLGDFAEGARVQA